MRVLQTIEDVNRNRFTSERQTECEEEVTLQRRLRKAAEEIEQEKAKTRMHLGEIEELTGTYTKLEDIIQEGAEKMVNGSKEEKEKLAKKIEDLRNSVKEW